MPRRLKSREGIWHYYRRVPRRFATVDPRTFVWISLETRDLSRAVKLQGQVERELEVFWAALLKGGSDDAHERYRGALERARLEGFEYRPVEDLAKGSVEDLVARMVRLEEIVVGADGKAVNSASNAQAVAATAGGASLPQLVLSGALDHFYAHTKDKVRRKSPDQLRRWKAPRLKAINNLVAIVGDKRVADLTRADALSLRRFWIDRVDGEDYTPNSANKDIGHLAQVFHTLDELLELGIGPVFQKLRLSDDQRRQRAAFSIDALKGIIANLQNQVVRELNDEARAIVFTMVETGMRPIEICNLDREDIFVDATLDIPFVKIRAKENREIKTMYSERDIPLVGISLEALKAFPGGFPRYRDKSTGLSSLVNQAFQARKLLPTPDHTLYSIRHTFQDRLTAAEMMDRMQADLMGHKFDRPSYGSGPTLKQKQEWLKRLAIS